MHGMHYRAIDEQGRVHTGFSNSRNLSELERWINHRGWQPLPVSLLQRIANTLGMGPVAVRWSKQAAAIFTQNFAQLLLAGVPLIQALEELIELESRREVRRALSDVHSKIDQGESLSAAITNYPGLFGSDYVASVKAGESSGKLSQCLESQAANLQWQSDLTQRFKNVLTYPLFACACLVVVFLFVLLYLVPAMLPLLSMNASPLPAHTLLLLKISEFVRHLGIISVLCTGSIVGILAVLWLSDSQLKNRIQVLLLRGTYGQIVTCFSLARFARSTGLLYESGVEITDAMHISLSLVANRVLNKQLAAAYDQVLNGASIGVAMQAQQALPTLFVRMIMAGERAGVLGVALRQCAEQLQSNAQYSLGRMERMIGPVMLCILGALLLWVAMAVLDPIYSAVGQAGAML